MILIFFASELFQTCYFIMKTFISFLVLTILLSCKNEPAKWPSIDLEPDTPAYLLAGQLSKKLAYLDPDINNILASCSIFDVKTGDLVTHMQLKLYQYLSSFKGAEAVVLEPQIQKVINRIAEHNLILNEAKNAGITATDAEVDSITQRNYKNSNGKERYLRILKSIGLDEDYANTEVRNQLMVKNYLNAVLYKDIKISESEIIALYIRDKTATVRHILLSTRDKSESEKTQIREEMVKLLQKVKTGADFAELAKQHSQDPGSAAQGGLIANFGRGAMVPEFEDAAFSIQPGEISDIVETQYGYHIIKVIERKSEERPLGEVRTRLTKQIRDQKRIEIYREKMAQLKSETGYRLIDFSHEN